MEYILGAGIIALLGSKFIKSTFNSIVFIGIIVISIVIAIIYKLPYIVSLSVCILVRYGLIDFFINLKKLGKSLIKSRKRYRNGYLQKYVYVLINCNYLLFSLLCYLLLSYEFIYNNVTSSTEEALIASIIVVISIKILSKILDKTVNKR